MEQELKNVVYSRDSIEFVTVAVQYCGFIESFEEDSMIELTDKLTKLLPLLYLKASLIPQTEMDGEEDVETIVTEEDYNYILSRMYRVFGKDDAYLEVFLEDMKYSETPITESVSENLADIYQDLKNFITVYERGVTEHMNDALYVCTENFKTYWGQKLVNVLGALHSIKYSDLVDDIDAEEDVQDMDMEENIW